MLPFWRIVNQNHERPFGVLVDTRLPVSHLNVTNLVGPFTFEQFYGSEPVELSSRPSRRQFIVSAATAEDFRSAFRNADAHEASE